MVLMVKMHINCMLTEKLQNIREYLLESGRFRGFPSGYCDVVAKILGACLAEVYQEDVIKKSGFMDKDGERGHSWICIGKINIDLTLDQFDFCNEPVIVSNDVSIWNEFTYDYREGVINHKMVLVEEHLGHALLNSACPI